MTKYLPHLGITAFIIFLATDYFVPIQSKVKTSTDVAKKMDEGSHEEGSHQEGSKGKNLSQEEKLRRMAIFHYNEGNKFSKEGNYKEAVIRYEKALHHNKIFKEAFINLSTAYMKIQLFDKAIETIQAGQNQFPKEPLFDYNLACYYSLRKEVGQSLSALKKAVGKGFKQFHQIENDSDLGNLRQSNEYKKWKKQELTTT